MSERFTMRLLDLLSGTATELVAQLGADACAISRAIGDVLIMVVESVPDGKTLQLGQGYLVPDYPRTQEVLVTRQPYALTLEDDGVDEAEASVLRELDYASLLMLPLDLGPERWGLVEMYRKEPRRFGPDEIDRAKAILAAVSAKAG